MNIGVEWKSCTIQVNPPTFNIGNRNYYWFSFFKLLNTNKHKIITFSFFYSSFTRELFNKKNFCSRVKCSPVHYSTCTNLNFWKTWFQKDAKGCSAIFANWKSDSWDGKHWNEKEKERENIHTRGEDKEDWKRVFNRYFQIRTHGPRGELKVNRIGSLSKRRVRLSKLITAGQRSRDTERNVNGCGSRMNEVDVASNCLIFHGEGEGYKNCRAT